MLKHKTSTPNPHAPKKNHFYAFYLSGDQEKYPDVEPVYYKYSQLMYMLY